MGTNSLGVGIYERVVEASCAEVSAGECPERAARRVTLLRLAWKLDCLVEVAREKAQFLTEKWARFSEEVEAYRVGSLGRTPTSPAGWSAHAEVAKAVAEHDALREVFLDLFQQDAGVHFSKAREDLAKKSAPQPGERDERVVLAFRAAHKAVFWKPGYVSPTALADVLRELDSMVKGGAADGHAPGESAFADMTVGTDRSYRPTLRSAKLADAYDAFMSTMGDVRRAERRPS